MRWTMGAKRTFVSIAGMVAWAGCSSAPSVPLPAGAPMAVVAAAPDTTRIAGVTRWKLFVGGADAAGADQLIAYGIDENEQAVTALRIVHAGDAAGTTGTIEFAMYKNGRWDEKLTADLAALTLTPPSRDVAGSSPAWSAAPAPRRRRRNVRRRPSRCSAIRRRTRSRSSPPAPMVRSS